MNTSEKSMEYETICMPIIKQIKCTYAQRQSSRKQYDISKHSFPENTWSIM